MMLPPEMPPLESNLTVMSFPNRDELLFRTYIYFQVRVNERTNERMNE
jgi:hypothetical protein